MDKINFNQAYGEAVISPEKITNIFNGPTAEKPLKISISFKMIAEKLYNPSEIKSQQQLSGMVRTGMGAYEYLEDFPIRRLYFDVDGVTNIKDFEKLVDDMVAYTGIKEYVITENEYSRHGGLSFHIFFRASMQWLAMRNYVRKYKIDAESRKVPCAECIDILPYMKKQTFRCVYSPNAINRHINYQEHKPDHLIHDPYLVELVNAYKQTKTTDLPNGIQEPRDFHFPIKSTYPPGYKKANIFFIQDTRDCTRILYKDPVNYVVPLDKEFKKMDYLIDDPEYAKIWERAQHQNIKESFTGRRGAGAKPKQVPRKDRTPRARSPQHKNTPKWPIPNKDKASQRDSRNSRCNNRSQKSSNYVEEDFWEKPINVPAKPVTAEDEAKALNELKEVYGARTKSSNKKSSRRGYTVSDF